MHVPVHNCVKSIKAPITIKASTYSPRLVLGSWFYVPMEIFIGIGLGLDWKFIPTASLQIGFFFSNWSPNNYVFFKGARTKAGF